MNLKGLKNGQNDDPKKIKQEFLDYVFISDSYVHLANSYLIARVAKSRFKNVDYFAEDVAMSLDSLIALEAAETAVWGTDIITLGSGQILPLYNKLQTSKPENTYVDMAGTVKISNVPDLIFLSSVSEKHEWNEATQTQGFTASAHAFEVCSAFLGSPNIKLFPGPVLKLSLKAKDEIDGQVVLVVPHGDKAPHEDGNECTMLLAPSAEISVK